MSRRHSRSPDNEKFGQFTWSFSEDTKKFTNIYNSRAQLLFCSWNLLINDVPVAVVFVAFLYSAKITMAIHLLPMNDVFTTSRKNVRDAWLARST